MPLVNILPSECGQKTMPYFAASRNTQASKSMSPVKHGREDNFAVAARSTIYTMLYKKRLENMQSSVKQESVKKADKMKAMLTTDQDGGKLWKPDANLYGYATKEVISQNMRVWRKKLSFQKHFA